MEEATQTGCGLGGSSEMRAHGKLQGVEGMVGMRAKSGVNRNHLYYFEVVPHGMSKDRKVALYRWKGPASDCVSRALRDAMSMDYGFVGIYETGRTCRVAGAEVDRGHDALEKMTCLWAVQSVCCSSLGMGSVGAFVTHAQVRESGVGQAQNSERT
jgi:hypothetical protein